MRREGRKLIGYRKDGRPIWLAMGGQEPAGQAPGSDGGQGPGAGGDSGQGAGAGAGATGSVTPPAATPPPPGTGGPFDHITDVGELRALAVRLQADAANQSGRSRDQARQQAAQAAQQDTLQKVAQALGLAPQEKVDPAALQGTITDQSRELAIYRVALAPGMDVNVGRLLDSRAFMRQAATVDPNADTATADIKQLITQAVASDQSLRAKAGAAPGGSAEHSGGAGDGQTNIDMSKLHGEPLLSAGYAANSAR